MTKHNICYLGFTQSELAKKCGISRCFLNQILNYRRKPTLETAIKIVRATDGALPLRELRPDIYAIIEKYP